VFTYHASRPQTLVEKEGKVAPKQVKTARQAPSQEAAEQAHSENRQQIHRETHSKHNVTQAKGILVSARDETQMSCTADSLASTCTTFCTAAHMLCGGIAESTYLYIAGEVNHHAKRTNGRTYE
jgi:hypothetical protein